MRSEHREQTLSGPKMVSATTDRVIDLSHWNTVDDFDAVRDAGVEGVVHKCTEDTDYVDPTYAARRSEAEGADLLWGAYHFLQPGNMTAQAEHFVNSAGLLGDVMLAVDLEIAGISLDDLKSFLRTVFDLTGQRCAIYSGHVIKDLLGDACDSELAQYRLWIAHYAESPSWPSATWPDWWLWQHTDSGSVAGISGDVDLDAYTGNRLSLEWTGERAPEPDTDVTIDITITVDAPPNVRVNVNVERD